MQRWPSHRLSRPRPRPRTACRRRSPERPRRAPGQCAACRFQRWSPPGSNQGAGGKGWASSRSGSVDTSSSVRRATSSWRLSTRPRHHPDARLTCISTAACRLGLTSQTSSLRRSPLGAAQRPDQPGGLRRRELVWLVRPSRQAAVLMQVSRASEWCRGWAACSSATTRSRAGPTSSCPRSPTSSSPTLCRRPPGSSRVGTIVETGRRHTARVHVLVAPDSFGGTLSAVEAAAAIAGGWATAASADVVSTLPLSDGGPGFVDVLAAALGGRREHLQVTGPLGWPSGAALLIDGDTAYVESAQACGLHLVSADDRNPAVATTYGVGELLHAVRRRDGRVA